MINHTTFVTCTVLVMSHQFGIVPRIKYKIMFVLVVKMHQSFVKVTMNNFMKLAIYSYIL